MMTKEGIKITASVVLDLLASKHSQDIFVPECKNGPTQSVSSYLRMDAWSMRRSWSRPEITAYEIKVLRSDFLNDNKWTQYLDYCHQFYFVAPKGVINEGELPDNVGYLEVSKNAKRLITKKKSPSRQLKIPEDLWRYLLICRSEIDVKTTGPNNVQEWSDWLEDKNAKRSLGYRVAGRISQYVRELENERDEAVSKSRTYERIKERIIELGEDPETIVHDWQAKNRLEKIISGLPDNFHLNVERSIRNLEKLLKDLE